jgi:hypothetical protein
MNINHSNLPRYPPRRFSPRDNSSSPSFLSPSLPSTSVSPTSSPRRANPPVEDLCCQNNPSGSDDVEKGHHSRESGSPASPCRRQIDQQSQDSSTAHWIWRLAHRIWCLWPEAFTKLCVRYAHYHEEYRIERKLCDLENEKNKYIKMIHKDTRYVGRWLRRFLIMLVWTIIATTVLINCWPFNTSAVEPNSEKVHIRRSSLDGSDAGVNVDARRRSMWKLQGSHAGTIFSQSRPFLLEICIVGSAFSMAQGLMMFV